VLSYWQLALVILLSGVAAFFGAYLKKKGENVATHEDLESLTREVEKLKTEYALALKKKEQAAGIAKLLADFSYKRKPDTRDYVADIWALSLWLPAPLVCHLTEFLGGKNSKYQDPKDLLIEIRKELHGAGDDLKAVQIAHIDPLNTS
jgi:menaquinone-dependent protoporphyrinogen IX oxidase